MVRGNNNYCNDNEEDGQDFYGGQQSSSNRGGGGNNEDDDNSDKEDERYEDVDLAEVVRRRDILKDPLKYKNTGCVFCLLAVRFKVEEKPIQPTTTQPKSRLAPTQKEPPPKVVSKAYPVPPKDKLDTLQDMVSKSRLIGNFTTGQGAMQIADWWNNKVVKPLNEMVNPKKQEAYKQVVADDILRHFNDHINTIEVNIYKRKDQISLLVNEIFDNGGIVREHKDPAKRSTKTGKMKRKFNVDLIKAMNDLTKTEITLNRELREVTSKKGNNFK